MSIHVEIRTLFIVLQHFSQNDHQETSCPSNDGSRGRSEPPAKESRFGDQDETPDQKEQNDRRPFSQGRKVLGNNHMNVTSSVHRVAQGNQIDQARRSLSRYLISAWKLKAFCLQDTKNDQNKPLDHINASTRKLVMLGFGEQCFLNRKVHRHVASKGNHTVRDIFIPLSTFILVLRSTSLHSRALRCANTPTTHSEGYFKNNCPLFFPLKQLHLIFCACPQPEKFDIATMVPVV